MLSKEKIEKTMRIIIGNAAMKGATAEEIKTLCDSVYLMMKYLPEPEGRTELEIM